MREPTRFHTPQPSGFAADVPPASGETAKNVVSHAVEQPPLQNADFMSDPLATADLLAELLPLTKPEQLVGHTVDGRYKIEEVIGEGGMGVVYRCRHKLIDKRFAMKVLRSDLARDSEVTERFLQEARAASGIGHEHIIDIHDFGHLPDGSTYFVMEYLEGQSLSEASPPGTTFSEARMLKVARQMAEGLAAAHEAGIVHRDLKPDNVFLTPRGADPDFVKILDFGIAKVSTSPTGQLTRAGAVFGTPHYMSPEQSSGAPVDHRGDIYALGVMLYELASGKVPFDADNFMGILTQHMYKAPVALRSLIPAPQVSPGFEAVVLKCMSKRPDHRYATMKELIADLDLVTEGRPPRAVADLLRRSSGFHVPAEYLKATRAPALGSGSPPRIRKRWPLLAGGLGALAGVAITALTFARNTPPPAPVATTPAVPPVVAAPPAPAPAPVMSKVAIAVHPIDAEVFRGDESLGTSPVVVEFAAGQKVPINVRSNGYSPQTFVLDGTETKLTVRLEKDKSARGASKGHVQPVASTAAVMSKAPPASSSDIVNPWGR